MRRRNKACAPGGRPAASSADLRRVPSQLVEHEEGELQVLLAPLVVPLLQVALGLPAQGLGALRLPRVGGGQRLELPACRADALRGGPVRLAKGRRRPASLLGDARRGLELAL